MKWKCEIVSIETYPRLKVFISRKPTNRYKFAEYSDFVTEAKYFDSIWDCYVHILQEIFANRAEVYICTENDTYFIQNDDIIRSLQKKHTEEFI